MPRMAGKKERIGCGFCFVNRVELGLEGYLF